MSSDQLDHFGTLSIHAGQSTEKWDSNQVIERVFFIIVS